MEIIEGYVDHIIYRNTENGYTVLVLVCDGEETTCVGTLPLLSEGQQIAARGEFTEHAAYGRQFKIRAYEEKEPGDAAAMERYLGSGAIKGIGAALAARIVKKFGDETFRIIEMEPERLAEVKGISRRKAIEIAGQMEEKKDMRGAMLFLQQYGISNNMSVKLYQRYGADIYRVIRENPYQLADEVTGIGFKMADEIARKAGISADSDFRIRSGILYVLLQASAEGHIYLPMDEVVHRTGTLLDIPLTDADDQMRDMMVEKKIVVRREEELRVYAASAYYQELGCARMLHDLNVFQKIDEKKVLSRLAGIEKHTRLELDELQRKAILEAARCGLMVITGGPGTGKTTTINAMIAYFESMGMNIALAAPTGRAAKRMTEATGHEARTIHRLLEVSGDPDTGSLAFGRDQETPLEEDVVIIDEMSMVDQHLLYALLVAVPIGTKLILVGDVNQLPSVGPGSVLKDIISSGCCSVVRLTRIFRQAQESDIVVNAHRINRGEHMSLDNKSKDFFFLRRQDANRIISNAITLVQDKLPRYVGAGWRDIQILTPTRKGLLGVERLNGILQTYLNPADRSKREYAYGDHLLREGDKVMQIRNNYQAVWSIRGRYGVEISRGTGIFNGDIGTVDSIDEMGRILTVEFDDGRMVEYPFENLDELELAYAVTIHKSQGSEYPAVVIPLLAGPQMLMNRNLLYTAVTRAKKCVVLVGDEEVFFRMIDNTAEQKRWTTLAERLKELEHGREEEQEELGEEE